LINQSLLKIYKEHKKKILFRHLEQNSIPNGLQRMRYQI